MALSEDVKKDMANIIRISSKYDVGNPANADTIIDHVLSKNLMSSSIGQEYINRLNEISSGKSISEYTCMFCNKNMAADGILCHECVKKYSSGKFKIYNIEDKEDISESSEGTPAVVEPVYCKQCGKELVGDECSRCHTKKGEGDKYCACCGRRLRGNKSKPVIILIIAVIVLLSAIACSVIFFMTTKKTDTQTQEADTEYVDINTNDDEFINAYKENLISYFDEIGANENKPNVDIVFDKTSDTSKDNYTNRYYINIEDKNVGGIYVSSQNGSTKSITVLSPLEAEGTSMLMIPAVRAVSPKLDSKEAASVIIEAISKFNNDIEMKATTPTKTIVGDYSYIYGNVDGVYMLKIECEVNL